MKSTRSRILRGVLALWLVAGCGRAPMSPQIDSTGRLAAPEVTGGSMSASRDAGVDATLPHTIQPPAEPPVDPGPEGGALETSATLSGSTGGTLRAADISLKIPKDAFEGDAEIRMMLPDSGKLEVHLEIFPASKNHFANPIKLEFDARSSGQDVRVMQILWFDPAAEAWVEIPSTIDTQTGKVSAELSHFSVYKASSEVQGRAGW